jgi:hypothetical protein
MLLKVEVIAQSSPLSLSNFVVLHNAYPIPDGEEAQYQYTSGGWVVGSNEAYGGSYLWHTGSKTFKYALAVLAPGKDVAVAALTNVGGTPGEVGIFDEVNRWFDGSLSLHGVEGGNSGGSGGDKSGAGPTTFRNFETVVLVVAGTIAFISW